MLTPPIGFQLLSAGFGCVSAEEVSQVEVQQCSQSFHGIGEVGKRTFLAGDKLLFRGWGAHDRARVKRTDRRHSWKKKKTNRWGSKPGLVTGLGVPALESVVRYFADG